MGEARLAGGEAPAGRRRGRSGVKVGGYGCEEGEGNQGR